MPAIGPTRLGARRGPNAFSRALAAVSLGCLAVVAWPSSATAGPADGYYAGATNSLRAQHDLAGYRVCSDLTAVANNWAAQMAANQALTHNPDYSGQVQGWSVVGENVGAGGSAAVVEQAFEGSAEHRGHLLSTTYTEVGYGTAVASDGAWYVNEVFRKPAGAACTGTRSPQPAPVLRVPAAVSPPPAAVAPADPTGALRSALHAAEAAQRAHGAIPQVFSYWTLVRSLPSG